MTFFLILLCHTRSLFFGKYGAWVQRSDSGPLDQSLFCRAQWGVGTGAAATSGVLENPQKGNMGSTAQGHLSRPTGPHCSHSRERLLFQGGREYWRMKSHFCINSGPHHCPGGCWHRTPASRGPWQSLKWLLMSWVRPWLLFLSVSHCSALRGGCMPFLKYRTFRVKHGQPV